MRLAGNPLLFLAEILLLSGVRGNDRPLCGLGWRFHHGGLVGQPHVQSGDEQRSQHAGGGCAADLSAGAHDHLHVGSDQARKDAIKAGVDVS